MQYHRLETWILDHTQLTLINTSTYAILGNKPVCLHNRITGNNSLLDNSYGLGRWLLHNFVEVFSQIARIH